MAGGLERARRDLAEGRPRLARERLKSLLHHAPDDTEVRRLLAEAYRRDGQPTEAGRWGFLDSSAASDEERRAFLTHHGGSPTPWISGWRMRQLLKHDNPKALADPEAAVLLEDVTRFWLLKLAAALLRPSKLRRRRPSAR